MIKEIFYDKGGKEEGVSFFMLFIMMLLLAGGIVGGVFAFFGQGLDFRQKDAEVLLLKVENCFSGNEDEKVDLYGNTSSNGFPVLWDTDNKEAKHRKEACAYCVFQNDRKRFFVKCNRRGGLYNPNGMDEEFKINRKTIDKGKTWNYTEVGMRTFEFYIKFLKTKNNAYLSNAEREIFNG